MGQNKKDEELNIEVEIKDENVICNWLKEHPSALFSVFSAMVVALSFIFRAVIYKNECKYLKYWHLDNRLIEISVSNQIYEIVGMVIFCLAMLLTQICMINSFEKYYEATKICICGKILLNNIKKEVKKSTKELKKLSKQIDKHDTKWLALIDKNKYLLNESNRNLTNIKSNLRKENKQIMRRHRKELNWAFLFIAIYLAMALIVYSSLCALDMGLFELFVLEIVIMLLFIVASDIRVGLSTRLTQRSTFKKLGYENQDVEYLQYVSEYKEKYIITTQKTKIWKNWFTDKLLALSAMGTILFLMMFLLLLNVGEDEKRKEQNVFDITYEENKAYVILYCDNTYLYMEEAEIEENSITIFVDRQRRITLDDVYSTNCIFENVVRIDNQGNVVE